MVCSILFNLVSGRLDDKTVIQRSGNLSSSEDLIKASVSCKAEENIAVGHAISNAFQEINPMMLRYLPLLATASLLIPIASVVAFAQQDSVPLKASPSSPILIAQFPPPPPPGYGVQQGVPPQPPWAQAINLSTEQKTRIRALHEQLNKETEGLRQQLLAADKQMRSLLASEASPERLRQQHQQIQKLRQQLDDKHFEMMLAQRQILTPAQRAQLAQWMQQNLPQPRKP